MDDGVVVEIRHQLPAGGSHREKGSYLVRAAARRVVRWPSPRVLAVGRGRAGLADGGRRRWWAARIPSDCRGWYNRRCLARGRSRVGGRQRPAGRRGPEYLVARVVVAGRVARRRPPRAPGAGEVLLVGLARARRRHRLQRDLAHHLGRRVLCRLVVAAAAEAAHELTVKRAAAPRAAARCHGWYWGSPTHNEVRFVLYTVLTCCGSAAPAPERANLGSARDEIRSQRAPHAVQTQHVLI